MKTNLLTLFVSSTEELRNTLSHHLVQDKVRPGLVNLNIISPQVLVRKFQLKDVALADVKRRLKLEAEDLLSTPAQEIELDFQILEQGDNEISGIFVCAPERIVEDYLAVLRMARLLPSQITSGVLTTINSFFLKHQVNGDRIGLIDFSQGHSLSLSVFCKQRCELLRTIPYENLDEIKHEVIQSLRSACANSSMKSFDSLYVYGDCEEKGILIDQVEKDFGVEIKQETVDDVKDEDQNRQGYFSLNLAKYFVLTPPVRNRMLLMLNTFLCAGLAICLSLGFKNVQAQKQIGQLKVSIQEIAAGEVQEP